MIINSNSLTNNKEITTEVCIVGGGVAGISVAQEFIDMGLDVVILESGNDAPNPELQSLNSGKNIGLNYYELDKSRVRAFGGTSHRWHVQLPNNRLGVRLRAMDKIDFEERHWVPYSGWPFGKEQLDPYYKRAHKICKIGPYTHDVNDWEDAKNSPRLPFKNDTVQTTIFQFARKDIFYNDWRKEIEKTKNITTYLNATVLTINVTDNAKQVKTVSVKTSSGKKFFVKATYYILALGGLETPRLLLLSDNVMKCGLGNQNDLVGRFFMEHPHLWSGFYYPSDPEIFERSLLYTIHKRSGIPIMGKLIIEEEVLRREKLLNFTTSIHHVSMLNLKRAVNSFKEIQKAIIQKKLPKKFKKNSKVLLQNLDCVIYAALRKLTGGNKNKWYNSDYRYYGFSLNIMAEQVPDPESRVLLDTARDKFGQRKIKLNWKLNSIDINSIRRAQDLIDREFSRSGLGRLDIELDNDEPPSDIHGGWHHMGTTRMHIDPQKGVVDQNCKIHGIHNLFIAGASVYPTGGYANPVLTTVALSIRLADHIKKLVNSKK